MLHSVPILRNRRKRPISESVGELLKAHGLGLTEIERRTDGRLSHSFLSKLLSGASANPRLDKLMELAELLDISISEIVGDAPIEPEGFRGSRFWELFAAYQRLELSEDRQIVDHVIDGTLRTIRAMPRKKADGRPLETVRKARIK